MSRIICATRESSIRSTFAHRSRTSGGTLNTDSLRFTDKNSSSSIRSIEASRTHMSVVMLIEAHAIIICTVHGHAMVLGGKLVHHHPRAEYLVRWHTTVHH
jgi:hypothetical protein